MIGTIFNYLMNGLTMGAIYALLAIGVTVVYKSMGMMNVAHANTVMLSAFATLMLYNATNSLVIACIVGIVVMGCFGFLLERFIYRRVNYDSFTNLMLQRSACRSSWSMPPGQSGALIPILSLRSFRFARSP